jgi:hypothetical protein
MSAGDHYPLLGVRSDASARESVARTGASRANTTLT